MMPDWARRLLGRNRPRRAERRRRGEVELALIRLERREVLSAAPVPVPVVAVPTLSAGVTVQAPVAAISPPVSLSLATNLSPAAAPQGALGVNAVPDAGGTSSAASASAGPTAAPLLNIAAVDQAFEQYGAETPADSESSALAVEPLSLSLGLELPTLLPLTGGLNLLGSDSTAAVDLSLGPAITADVNLGGGPLLSVTGSASVSAGTGGVAVSVGGGSASAPAPPVLSPGPVLTPGPIDGGGSIIPVPTDSGSLPASPTDAHHVTTPDGGTTGSAIAGTTHIPTSDGTAPGSLGTNPVPDEAHSGLSDATYYTAGDPEPIAEATAPQAAQPDRAARQRLVGARQTDRLDAASERQAVTAAMAATASADTSHDYPRLPAGEPEVSEQLAALLPAGIVADPVALERVLRELRSRLGQAEDELETLLARLGVAPWGVAAVTAALAGGEMARRTLRQSRKAAPALPDGIGLT